jgi:mannose PTS system EIIA component
MVGALVVTHGHLAQELLTAAEMIVGEISHIHAVSIGWHDDVNEARKEIERRIAEVDAGSGVLILTDMFGGTPSNIAFPFHEAGKVDVITGVNLPIIIRIANQKAGETIADLARAARDQGRSNISLASDFLSA